VLGVLGVGLAMSPVRGLDAPGPSAADQAFLASLALPEVTAAPEPAAKRPAILRKAACSASCGTSTLNCPAGTTSCTGVDRNCAAGEPGHVICNGVTTYCAACPVDCSALAQQCADNCGSCPIRTFQCSPYRCTCDTSHGPCT
jgi:hypothetical protein